MALPPDYVDGMYRNVLTCVKASNGIPSDEADYHFQHKFNKEFRTSAVEIEGRVTSLLHRLRHINIPGQNPEDVDIMEFDPLEENGPLTDLVDSLLEKASRQIVRFQKGEVDPTPAPTPPVVLPTTQTNSNLTKKPQELFEDKIDNSDTPFVAKLRAKVHGIPTPEASQPDDDEIYHPYRYEISNLKYQPWQLQPTENKREMISLEDATYSYVDTVEDLEAMLEVLQEAPMFAVDLENHSYHSFQGFLCLMQISTWENDWLVDTLALRSHLHRLNIVFCDPTKQKVLHGSDSDIIWLQRDLGLYIVNMFDTGQAARCLQYPRFSLAYLLKTHCNVTADKQYQLADWRVRPLDDHLVKYAREDTRYLLYIYEILKAELIASDSSDQNLLYSTLSRSQTLCLNVYQKPSVPTLDDVTHLCFKLKSTVGLQTVTDEQLRIMEQLVQWRDRIARQTDESPGYVCPNAALMKIMKGMPSTPAQLFRLCNPIPPLVRKYAHELTVLLNREGVPKNIAVEHKVNLVERPQVQRIESTEESSQLYAFKGWDVVARKAKGPSTESTGLFSSSTSNIDNGSAQILEEVRQAFASKEFVVIPLFNRQESVAPSVQVPKVETKVEEPAIPMSLTEKYPKLKKQKVNHSKPTKSTTENLDEPSTTESFQAFDYAAQTLPSSVMDLDAKPPMHRNKRKKGYNPFVAATDDSAMGAINQKRGYNAPRSSTYR